jgi:hypothetical protein
MPVFHSRGLSLIFGHGQGQGTETKKQQNVFHGPVLYPAVKGPRGRPGRAREEVFVGRRGRDLV